MDPSLNPFSPGSGLRPPTLVGRNDDIRAMEVLTIRAKNGLAAPGIMLNGLRGVGKTVLLNSMRMQAERAGWVTIKLEARPDEVGTANARHVLARELAARARRLTPKAAHSTKIRAALSAISSFNLKFGVSGIDLGVQITKGRADSGIIEVDLPELVEDISAALLEENSAIGVFIDELQDLDASLLRALLVTQHQAGQQNWPFFLIGAGLPNLPATLAESRSYAERLFDYRTIGRVNSVDAALALTKPLSAHGANISADALHYVLDAADGYPYFLQMYGSALWDAASSPQITLEDAKTAVAIGINRLDDGFFRSRWERATPAERRILAAMSDDNGISNSSELARRVGLKSKSLGSYRSGLIAKGLVFAPDHGLLAYTVPGMADFVNRHRETL